MNIILLTLTNYQNVETYHRVKGEKIFILKLKFPTNCKELAVDI